MSKNKTNLQKFADRYGLTVSKHSDHCIMGPAIKGPNGELWEAYAGWSYFQRSNGYHRFNPIAQAKHAIEAIGLKYTAPSAPVKKHQAGSTIVKRADGWYVGNHTGPFKTRELARIERDFLEGTAK